MHSPAPSSSTNQSAWKRWLTTRPYFLFLLPVFFVIHGLAAYRGSVSVTDGARLLLRYEAYALLVFLPAWRLLKNPVKAGLLSFTAMGLFFFFGNIQDLLHRANPGGFFSQYRFLLPLLLLVCVLAFRIVRKREQLSRTVTFLNLLLFLFLGIEAVRIGMDSTGSHSNRLLHEEPESYRPCDDCSKPDIYFILPDQYAGNQALSESMGFDNGAFARQLEKRGFVILPDSRSNYNLTPFSVASTLNMDYLSNEWKKGGELNIGYCYQLIRKSRVVRFLETQGYAFHNLSIFDFPGQPAHRYESFLPYGSALINRPTLAGRLERDWQTALLEGKFDFRGARRRAIYANLEYNDKIIRMIQQLASAPASQPRFVYAHLMLPHFPYYFDRNGQPREIAKLISLRNTNTADYLGYLEYANTRLIGLIDDILRNAKRPSVILLLSDHGFRQPEKNQASPYEFSNLNAAIIPGGDSSLLREVHSNVNVFRVLFNHQFRQQFPLLPDSTINVRD